MSSARWCSTAAVTLALLLTSAPRALALENGLARKPPMGWASWNTYAGDVEDSLFRLQADAMVASGMRDAGYEYVIIDEPGFKRGANGELVPDAQKFPDGIKPLVDYIHDKGLKAGIYTTRGRTTCLNLGYAGVQGFEAQDAKQFADWGFDYVKDDDCDGNAPSPEDAKPQYEKFRDALALAGRPMVFSLVTWWTQSAPFGADTGNLWRIAGDIRACWSCTQGVRGGTNGVVVLIDRAEPLAGAARPGAWNDADMLEVGVSVEGNPGLTAEENRAHFAMWAMLASPLLAGNDLTTMKDEVRDILVDRELIAISQDALGFQAVKVRSAGGLEVWVKPLSGIGTRAVALFNRSDTSGVISARWSDLGLATAPAKVRNISQRADLGVLQDGVEADVPAHGVVVLRVEGRPADIMQGESPLSRVVPAYASNHWGPVELDRSNGEQASGDGGPLSAAGRVAQTGIGVSAPSRIAYELRSQCDRLTALTGVDDETAGKGSVVFEVYGDGKRLYRGDSLFGNAAAVPVDVDVSGVDLLELVVSGAGDSFDYDHADWLDARIDCEAMAPSGGSGGASSSGGSAGSGGTTPVSGSGSGAAGSGAATSGTTGVSAAGSGGEPTRPTAVGGAGNGCSCRLPTATNSSSPPFGVAVVFGATCVAVAVRRKRGRGRERAACSVQRAAFARARRAGAVCEGGRGSGERGADVRCSNGASCPVCGRCA